MPTVAELTGPYENFLLAPQAGRDVCDVCFTFTSGYSRCFACRRIAQSIDLVAPISYSVACEQLHYALAAYKRVRGDVGRQLSVQLAAVLWRYLARHEPCLARAVGAPAFDLVTTVPSSDRERDESHPLRRIVGELVGPTRGRHQRLLRRSDVGVGARAFHPGKYAVDGAADGRAVLLIDDTWTTGANAQSAAAALKGAGAGPIAAVVIGRHLKRDFDGNDRRLRGVWRRFDWERCVVCGGRATPPSGG